MITMSSKPSNYNLIGPAVGGGDLKHAFVLPGKVIDGELLSPLAAKGSVLLQPFNGSVSLDAETCATCGSGRSLHWALDQFLPGQGLTHKVPSDNTLALYEGITDKPGTPSPTCDSFSRMLHGVGEAACAFKSSDTVTAAGVGLEYQAVFIVPPWNLALMTPEEVISPIGQDWHLRETSRPDGSPSTYPLAMAPRSTVLASLVCSSSRCE